MNFIREYCPGREPGKGTCVVRTETYAKFVAHFNALLVEAQRDFPRLTADVEVAHYAGRRYKGTYGIEFPMEEAQVPETYSRLSVLEYHL